MKPNRLAGVPQSSYTPEDVRIWLTVCPKIRHLLTWARYSDQLDAELMYKAMSWRRVGQTNIVRPEGFRLRDSGHRLVNCGGDLGDVYR